MIRSASLIALGLVAGACRHRPPVGEQAGAGVSLRADSASFTVRLNGQMYEGDIGFHFANNSGATLSLNYCVVPPPPLLEKQRADGTWGFAYSGITLTCLYLPPYRIPSGGTYDGTLRIVAGRPGTNFVPVFAPDSIPGVYRLRWELRAGNDPDNRAAPLVSAVSSPFRLVSR